MQINGKVLVFQIKCLLSGQTKSRDRSVSSWPGAVGEDGWTLGLAGRKVLRLNWLQLLMLHSLGDFFFFLRSIVKLAYFVSTIVTLILNPLLFHLFYNSLIYQSELSSHMRKFVIFYNFFIKI